MRKKEVKFVIDEELKKKFKKMIKDKNDRNKIINNFIKNYVDNEISELNIDNILDKVEKYGTVSLKKEERDFLNNI